MISKELLGYISIGLTILAFIPYFRDIFRGRTKPHAMTWFIWALLTGIAFFAQVIEGGGPGAWATGLTAAICVAVTVLALWRGEKHIATSDWVTFVAGLLSLIPWYLTESPLLSVILITVIDGFGYWPTIRKSWDKPFEETLSTYLINILKFTFAVAALENFIFVNWFYPVAINVMNLGFVVMVIYRKRVLLAADGVDGA